MGGECLAINQKSFSQKAKVERGKSDHPIDFIKTFASPHRYAFCSPSFTIGIDFSAHIIAYGKLKIEHSHPFNAPANPSNLHMVMNDLCRKLIYALFGAYADDVGRNILDDLLLKQ